MAYTTIDNPADYFNTVLYTGDASSPRTISGVGFQADLNWTKSRNSADYDHNVADSVRGTSAYYLKTNTDVAETGNPAAGYVSSFNSDGYVLTAGGSNNTNYNNNTTTYVSWNWKESATAGFDIVTFTGNGSNRTISHSLGSAADLLIVKRRDDANDWRIGSSALTNWVQHVNLNTYAASDALAAAFNSTAPTSSVFSVGTSPSTNADGGTYLAYLFRSVQGYSRVGNFVGNASTNGTMVWTGFRPAYVIFKKTSGSNANWQAWDNKRDPENSVNNSSLPDDSAADQTDQEIDFLSTGFKIRTTGHHVNGSGIVFLYMAFAEQPFVNSNGVPCNAR